MTDIEKKAAKVEKFLDPENPNLEGFQKALQAETASMSPDEKTQFLKSLEEQNASAHKADSRVPTVSTEQDPKSGEVKATFRQTNLEKLFGQSNPGTDSDPTIPSGRGGGPGPGGDAAGDTGRGGGSGSGSGPGVHEHKPEMEANPTAPSSRSSSAEMTTGIPPGSSPGVHEGAGQRETGPHPGDSTVSGPTVPDTGRPGVGDATSGGQPPDRAEKPPDDIMDVNDNEVLHIHSGESANTGRDAVGRDIHVQADRNARVTADGRLKHLTEHKDFVVADPGSNVIANNSLDHNGKPNQIVFADNGSQVMANDGSIVFARPNAEVNANPGAHVFTTADGTDFKEVRTGTDSKGNPVFTTENGTELKEVEVGDNAGPVTWLHH